MTDEPKTSPAKSAPKVAESKPRRNKDGFIPGQRLTEEEHRQAMNKRRHA